MVSAMKTPRGRHRIVSKYAEIGEIVGATSVSGMASKIAPAFAKAQRWWITIGIPTAITLERRIHDLRDSCDGFDQCDSGGLLVERRGLGYFLMLEVKLHQLL